MKFNMAKIASALAFASTGAMAGISDGAISTGGTFTMFSQKGLDQAGVVDGTWNAISIDTTISAFVDQAAGTWGVASNTPFYGLPWTASNGQLISSAGSYSMNVVTGAIGAGTGVTAADGIINFNVGVNQMAGTIDFAWGATTGIRVVNVWNFNMDGSLTTYAAPGMENGPFPGFNAVFNLNSPLFLCNLDCDYIQPPPPPPFPEASTYSMMLAGLGVVCFMVRRKKQAETQVR